MGFVGAAAALLVALAPVAPANDLHGWWVLTANMAPAGGPAELPGSAWFFGDDACVRLTPQRTIDQRIPLELRDTGHGLWTLKWALSGGRVAEPLTIRANMLSFQRATFRRATAEETADFQEAMEEALRQPPPSVAPVPSPGQPTQRAP